MSDALRAQMTKRLDDMRVEAQKMHDNLSALKGAIWDTEYWLAEVVKLATPPTETEASPAVDSPNLSD